MFYLCGCYYTVPSSDYYAPPMKRYLPTLDITAHSTILSSTSRTVLKQTFTNPSATEPIKECIYTFPLYDGVSVVSFTCRIGEKILTGVVQEKFKAKQTFNDAVARGETAGLLEQAPQSSDVFSTKLGNIPAGGNVIVEIAYIGELKLDATGGIRFTIPTSIAPRYGEGPQTAAHSAVQTRAEQGMKIKVDVNMPEGLFIKKVQSPSHPIIVGIGTTSTNPQADPTMSKASASLSLGSTALDQDFVVIVEAKDVGTPKAVLEYHPTIPNQRALMATLVPKFSLPPARPEIVFVADRSGSMSGNIQMLTSAMNVFLKSMPVGVKFNICSFGSTHSFLWPQSQPYNADTLAHATSHLSTFAANMGGTETFGAIKATIERRFTDIPLELVLLTDGDIWSQDQLFQYVNQQVEASKGQIRIFPLGIGNGVSHALIEGLARAGNGFASAVQLGERLENSVVRMLRGALSPHITDYTLEVKYRHEDDDFEMIETVTEGISVMSSEDRQGKSKASKPTISLFDNSAEPAEPEEDSLNDPNQSQYAHLPEVSCPKILQAPHRIPTLFAFSRTSVYLLLSPDTIQRDPTSIVLRATSIHGPLELEIPVEALPTPGETIHQLAAKKAIQELEEGRGWIYDGKDQEGNLVKDKYQSCFQEMVEREAVRLGEKFQIAGKWTSFVAVEENGKENGEIPVEAGADFMTKPQLNAQPANVTQPPIPYGSVASAPSQQLQDYQMGLMVLQQQNKKRNFMARGKLTKSHLEPRKGITLTEQAVSPQDAAPAPATVIERGEKFGGLEKRSKESLPGASARFRQRKCKSGQSSDSQLHEEANSGSLFGNTSTPNAGFPGPNLFGDSSSDGSAAPRPFGAPNPMALTQGSNLFGAAPILQPQATGGLFGGVGYAQQSAYSAQQSAYSAQQSAYSAPSARRSSRLVSAQPPPQPHRTGGLFGGGGFGSAPPAPPSAPMPISAPFGSASAVPPGGGYVAGVFGSSNGAPQSAPIYATPLFQPPIELAKAAPTAADWASKSPVDKMLGLISLQDFEGSWPENSGAIKSILGIDVDKNRNGSDLKVWVTLVVIKYFELTLSEGEGTWELVVEKARGWLEGTGITHLGELEAEAGRFVNEKFIRG